MSKVLASWNVPAITNDMQTMIDNSNGGYQVEEVVTTRGTDIFISFETEYGTLPDLTDGNDTYNSKYHTVEVNNSYIIGGRPNDRFYPKPQK